MKAYAEGMGALIGELVGRLRALTQPPVDQATLAAMYAQLDQVVTFSRQAAAAASNNDNPGITQAMTEANATVRKANASAKAFGLTVCGEERCAPTWDDRTGMTEPA